MSRKAFLPTLSRKIATVKKFNMLLKWFVSVLGCLGCLSSNTALAVPVNFDIRFSVEAILSGPQFIPIDPRIRVGSIYSGATTIDSAILDVDGINKPGNVSRFLIRFEEAFWELGSSDPNNLFVGFRGPLGFFAQSPGFDVQGGSIVNIRGGVFSGGDAYFVDFSTGPIPTTQPPCSGDYCGGSPNNFITRTPLGSFSGSYTVSPSRVPAPATTALVSLALLMMYLVSISRYKPRTTNSAL